MTATTFHPETLTPEVLEQPFLQELIRQIRAQDSFGTYRTWSDALLLKPFILSREEKKAIALQDTVSPLTRSRIFTFYRAIAACIEQETGLLAQVSIDLNEEGFGWALVFCGRLLVVRRSLRDAQRFGFPSLEKLLKDADKLVQTGLELADQFPSVGNL